MTIRRSKLPQQRLGDFGEDVKGARKDTGTLHRDIVDSIDCAPMSVSRILEISSRAAVWTIELPTGTTGTAVFLQQLRSKVPTLREHLENLLNHEIGAAKTGRDSEEVLGLSARYRGILRGLKEIVAGASNVEEAA